MSTLEALAGEIIERASAGPGAAEFKRTLQRGDGTATVTIRVAITEIDESGFLAAILRQAPDGSRREIAPRRFARADRAGLAAWLAREADV